MPPTERNQEAAEKALKERSRLYAQYRRAKSAHRRSLYEQEPRLREFALQLQRFGGEEAEGFLRFIKEESRSWLCTAPPELRAEALALIDERIVRIREKAGMLPLDDPLPGQDDNVWQLCRRELA
jgi:hypothetical protein